MGSGGGGVQRIRPTPPSSKHPSGSNIYTNKPASRCSIVKAGTSFSLCRLKAQSVSHRKCFGSDRHLQKYYGTSQKYLWVFGLICDHSACTNKPARMCSIVNVGTPFSLCRLKAQSVPCRMCFGSGRHLQKYCPRTLFVFSVSTL